MNETDARANFAINLRAALAIKGISTREAGRRLNASEALVSTYTTEKNFPAIGTFVDLCDLVGKTPDELLGYRTPLWITLEESPHLLS